MTFLMLGMASAPAFAASSAVVFMYHRFGESKHPSTNVTMAQFKTHLEYLDDNDFNVMSLPDILERLQNGDSLPDKTVAITIDDAYLSVYEKAWPLFEDYDYPFTLFVATDAIDRRFSDYMSWDQIEDLADEDLVTIGSQGAAHFHYPFRGPTAVKKDISQSNERIEDETDVAPKLFAYPYGEYSADVVQIMKDFGFTAAFGQHSGAVFAGSDMYALPRFALNEQYGDLDRFKMAANTKALPVSQIVPSNPLISQDMNPPAFGFTIDTSVTSTDNIACFASDIGKVEVIQLGESRVEVRLPEAFPDQRNRINCTKNAGSGQWYWFGQPFFVKK